MFVNINSFVYEYNLKIKINRYVLEQFLSLKIKSNPTWEKSLNVKQLCFEMCISCIWKFEWKIYYNVSPHITAWQWYLERSFAWVPTVSCYF